MNVRPDGHETESCRDLSPSAERAVGKRTTRPAEAVTTLRELLLNRSVHEHTVTARYYRDSRGRVRGELDTPWGVYVVLRLFNDDVEPVIGPPEGMRFWVVDFDVSSAMGRSQGWAR